MLRFLDENDGGRGDDVGINGVTAMSGEHVNDVDKTIIDEIMAHKALFILTVIGVFMTLVFGFFGLRYFFKKMKRKLAKCKRKRLQRKI